MSILSLPRHHTKHHPAEASIPVAKPQQRPTGVPAAKLGCAPGTSRRVLDELRADDRPITPTAIRRAFDSRTWVPSLRSVPLIDDVDTVVADILASFDAVPFVRHEAAFVLVLAPLAAMLDQATPVTDWPAMLADADRRVLDLLSAQDYRNARDFESELAAYDQSQRAVIDVQRALLDDIDMVGLDAVRVRQALTVAVEVSL